MLFQPLTHLFPGFPLLDYLLPHLSVRRFLAVQGYREWREGQTHLQLTASLQEQVPQGALNIGTELLREGLFRPEQP